MTVADHEVCGSHPEETQGKHLITRRKRVLVISAAVVIAAAHFAWNAFYFEDTDTAEVRGHVMPVSARINGNIKDVYVSEGQLVHAGEVPVTIDPEDYKIQYRADYWLAEAELQQRLAALKATYQQ